MLLALVAMMMPIGAWAYNEPESVSINIGTSGVATLYYGAHNLVIPKGVSASVITRVDVNEDGTVTVKEQVVDNIIPADCAVILRGESGSYDFAIEVDPVEVPESNFLRGTDELTTDTEEGYLYFTLDNTQYNTSNSAYFKDWIYVGNEVNNQAHKAYLALPVEDYPGLAAMLEALDNPHLQHTHGGCEICDQVTEVSWGTTADALTSYGTLTEAVAAAAGEEGSNIGYIKLLADVESTGYTIEGDFTLDLNGHTISSEEHTLDITGNKSNVTIVDNSGTNEGKVITLGAGCFSVGVSDGASVTISDGIYKSTYYSALNVNTNGSATINGGTFTSIDYYAIYNSGNLEIVKGTIKSEISNAIFTNGNLIIKGGTFTSTNNLATINYESGSINLSEYENITDISISSWIDPSFTPSAATILLPEGYYFFDNSDDTPVTVLVYGGFYYIDVEPAKYTIAFNAGDGEGEMEGEIIYEGDYTLPECTFTAPEGMMFKAWQIGDDEENLYQPGEEITVTADIEIKAVWTEYVPQIVIKMSDSGEDGWNGASITVKKDGEELDETVTIENGTEATVTLVYDLDSRYTFYWNMGSNDGECSFEIIVNGESEYTGSGGGFSDDIEFFFALGDPFVVSFNANDGSGSMDDIETYESVTLPECTFTAPEGMMFDGWQVGDDEENLYQPGEEIPVTADTEVTAVWGDIKIVINMYDSAGDGWHGAYIDVLMNGESIGTATLVEGEDEEGGEDGRATFDYDSNCTYSFIWHYGPGNFFPDEISFEISIGEEQLFTSEKGDCEEYLDEQQIYPLPTLDELAITDGTMEEFNMGKTKVGTLTYTRTLPNLMWNALYVPFEIPVSALIDNYDVAYVNDVHSFDTNDDGKIDDLQMEIIKITLGTLKANYPYLIRAKNVEAKVMNLELTDDTLRATIENKVTCSSVFMQFDVTGTYNTMSQADYPNILAISPDGSWKKLAEGSKLKPFRLYLTLTALDGSPVKVEEEALTRMRIVIRGEEGNETGIDQITTSHDKQTTTYYDLSGRRVKTPVKGGLYIVNGKKVVY